MELDLEGDIAQNVEKLCKDKDIVLDGMLHMILLGAHLKRNKIL